MKEIEIRFGESQDLAGVLRIPDTDPPYPLVLLCHGTIEQDRDGNLLSHPSGREIPKRNFFLHLSEALIHEGIATFSWDKRGYGASGVVRGDYYSDAEDARSAWHMLSHHPLIRSDHRLIFGQSAGVHTACLLARSGIKPRGYLFSGGLCSDYLSMLEYNYLRPVNYAARGPSEREFVMTYDPWGYALGVRLPLLKEAVIAKKSSLFIDYQGGEREWKIDLRLFSGDLAPMNLFQWINAPSLIIHGEADLNVPQEDAYQIQSRFLRMGLLHTLVTIPDADHSFQQSPHNLEDRIRERISLACFLRPYIPGYFETVATYCRRCICAENY